MKKSFTAGLLLFLIMGFSFVSEQKASPQKVYIPVIINGIHNAFWDPVTLGIQQAATDYGIEVTIEAIQSETNIQEQLDLLEAALARNPQAITLATVDAKAVTPYLEEAQAKGIPIISIGSGVDSPIVTTTVGTDNYQAGAIAAEKLAGFIDGKGKVGIVIHENTSKGAIDRRDGFLDTLEQQYPGIQIIPPQYGEGDVASEATKIIIAANPDIKGIFGGNEGSAEGVIEAVKELNKTGEITIVGFDSGKQLVDAIREGIVEGAVTQNPMAIGYKGVEAAYKAYIGERLPPFINTGFAWYDRSNIDNPEIQELLYK